MESKFEDDLDDIKQQMVNGVAYVMPPESSMAVRRTHKRQFPQKSSLYKSQEEIIIDLNSGSQFLDPRRSWFNFSVVSSARCGRDMG